MPPDDLLVREADPGPALVAATLAASATEAFQALAAALRAHAGPTASLAAFACAFGLLAFPSTVLALVLGAIVRRPELRRFLSRAPALLGGGDSPLHAGVGLFLGNAAVASAAIVGGSVGRNVGKFVSVDVGASITTVAVLVTLGASALAAASAAPVLVTRARPTADRLERMNVPLRSLPLGASAIVLVAALGRLLPRELLTTATVGALGYVVTASPSPLRTSAGRSSPRRKWRFASALALSALAFPSFAYAPSVARAIVLNRTPFAGAVVLALRVVVDRDGDGYSPILAGGDCDDGDPAVHPGARDEPNNGIDENCSGRDAAPYVADVPVSSRPASAPERPNFLLVQIDALRPDHLGFAGYRRPTSPNLDRFRASATWFRRTYTPAPSTRFAMSSLFTGLDVERVPQKRGPGLDFEMLGGVSTFAEALAGIGYDRVGYTISYVLQHIKGVGRGFRIWDTPWPVDDWERTYPVSATLTTDAALKYLATQSGDERSPYLLFLHYRCTHDPYAVSPRFPFGASTVDLYDSAVAYCDDEIGRLLADVERRADASRTVVVLFSDHGELFGEHGFENHGNTLFESDVRSLLLARVPGLGIRTVETPVSLADLDATIRTLAGVHDQASRSAFGLLALLEHGDSHASLGRPLFLYADLVKGTTRQKARGVVVGRFKFLRDLSTGSSQLFDVVADPAERSDLGASLPHERAVLDEMLEGWEAVPRTTNVATPAR